MSISIGDTCPSFSLQNQHGQIINIQDYIGSKNLVIYFYPKDDTSGCTAEACEFQEQLSDFPGKNVFGVSPDPVKSHRKFADKYNLEFTLLADTETALCEACGVWAEKSMYGKKYMGVLRTTFVVDANGVVTHVFEKVKPQGHAAEIRAAIG
jgi:peroxiredoxin Q/BCP